MKHYFQRFFFVLALAILTGCEGSKELSSKEPLLKKVIEQVQKGKLTETSSNSIELPPEFKIASVDGKALVSRPSTNQLILVFKTWRGKGNNMEGFLYAAQPLTNNEIKIDYYGQKVISIGTIDLTLGKQIKTNWYQVSYRLD